MVSELQDARDWYYLGLCLGVPFAKLQSIKQDYKHIEERKREVLLAWSDKEKPTWLKVVNVLVDMRNISLANRIAQKYGNCCCVDCIYKLCTDEALKQSNEVCTKFWNPTYTVPNSP